MSLNSRLVIVFLSAVLARVVFHQITGFIADDAFITFRYARNLSEGLGFVYNQGEPVMGTSTPLFTLLLASFSVAGISPITSALAISILAAGVTATILYRFALSLRFTRMAFLLPLAYILFPRSVVADTCGMETALFTMFVAGAFYFQHRGLIIYAAAMATMATATRPEGAFLLALLLVFDLYYHREQWGKCLIVPMILLVPWLVFSWIYFGTPVPNSIPGKLALYSQFDISTPLESFVYIMAWHNPFGWILTAAVVAGARWLNKKQNFGWLEITWLLTMVLFYTFSQTVVFFWYIAPIYPIYLLFAVASLPMLFDYLAEKRYPRLKDRSAPFVIAVTVLLVGALALGNYRPIEYYSRYQNTLEDVHLQIGRFLFQNTKKSDLIAAEDIGYIGYYSHRRILDRDGLVSSATRVYNRQAAYADLIYDFEPDWVVAGRASPISGFISDSLFLSEYQRDTTFGRAQWRYDVFRRKKQSSAPDTGL
jgi:arabinofuranosyltransferase